jgi:hypothetical protein
MFIHHRNSKMKRVVVADHELAIRNSSLTSICQWQASSCVEWPVRSRSHRADLLAWRGGVACPFAVPVGLGNCCHSALGDRRTRRCNSGFQGQCASPATCVDAEFHVLDRFWVAGSRPSVQWQSQASCLLVAHLGGTVYLLYLLLWYASRASLAWVELLWARIP